jgi:hypothetical protein
MSVQRHAPAPPELDLPLSFGRGPRALRRSWVVATTLGEALGFMVPALAATVAFDLYPAFTFVLMLGAGVVEGIVLGTAQAFVLRREFLGFSRGAWIGVTALGAGIAWFIGMLPSTFYLTWSDWPLGVTIPLAVVLGGALLASIGLAQWTVLRRHVARSRTWAPVNALAWAAGLGLLVGITTPLWREGQSTVLVVGIGVLGGLAMALTVAAVTGWWLARLVRPFPARASRPRPVGVPEADWVALGASTDEFRVFDPVLVADLPEPVQRWLVHTVAPGAALLTGVDAEWTGHLHLGRSWRLFYARHRATKDGGFIWAARTRQAGLPVTGFDRFTRDEGEMRWRLLRRVRLASAAGEEVTRSVAGRHAAEVFAFVPPVALDPSIRWEEVDHLRATAHLMVGGEEQTVTLGFDPIGRLRQVETDRWGTPPGEEFGLHRFGALLGEERRFDGYLVPTEVVVGWHIGTDRWDEGVFLRFRVVRCSFH